MNVKKLIISRKNFIKIIVAGLISVSGITGWFFSEYLKKEPKSEKELVEKKMENLSKKKYLLPVPKFSSNIMVEEAISWRRSIREYKDEPISIESLSSILWASQGINEFNYSFRTIPSAGATYPLEVYAIIAEKGVLIKESDYLVEGSYKYDGKMHSIELVKEGDFSEELAKASLNQNWIKEAPINIVVCALYERTERRYGDRGQRYVHMEDGHVSQNIYLMAAALYLGTVAVGAFYDEQVRNVIKAEIKEKPLYIMPIGIPKKPYRIEEKEISEYYEMMREGNNI